MKKLYIAYGSNLNIKQMAYRCPTARIYCTGYLPNWTLRFHSHSMSRNAFATILPQKGSRVPVAIWELDNLSEQALDVYEGYPVLYYKQNIECITEYYEKIIAMVYIMNKESIPGIPSQKYINTIAEGYVDNNFEISQLISFIKEAQKKTY